MIIRQADTSDLEEIYQLVQEAFEPAEESDGSEHDLVRALTTSKAFVPELSLVAQADTEEGQLIGYILFTEVSINNDTALALAPLAVKAGYRGQGVGRSLIEEGHQRAKDMGYPLSVVLGSDTYYSQFAYEPAATFGITAPFEVPSKYFRVRLLTDPLSIKGEVEYAPEFGI